MCAKVWLRRATSAREVSREAMTDRSGYCGGRRRGADPRRERRELEVVAARALRWTLQHAYANNAGYRRKLRCRRGASQRSCGLCPTWRASRSPPRRICARHIPSASSPFRWSRLRAYMPRPAPPANRRSSAIPPKTSRPGAVWSPARSAPPAAARGMKVHVGYGYGLFTGGLGAHYGAEAARLHRHSHVRRPDRTAGAADHGFSSRHHHDDAELHARHLG